jgi:hypothetical protein
VLLVARSQTKGGQHGVKTPYTANQYGAKTLQTSAHDALTQHDYQKKGNDHFSRKQQAEAKKVFASHGFDRIFGACKGRDRPLRNLAEIPEDRIEGANSINTEPQFSISASRTECEHEKRHVLR